MRETETPWDGLFKNQLEDVLHLIPMNDWIDHEQSRECVCGPDFYYKVAIHHSLDGRESS